MDRPADLPAVDAACLTQVRATLDRGGHVPDETTWALVAEIERTRNRSTVPWPEVAAMGEALDDPGSMDRGREAWYRLCASLHRSATLPRMSR